jgi:DNA-binding transcriptional regulator GbsR (MarR family)
VSKQAVLPQGSVEFVEGMGIYFAQYDLPRIFGRILGLLMISERPLPHDEIAKLLGVSRGSVSTNMRLGLMLNLVERVAAAGDRRDFYRQSGDAWGRSIEAKGEQLAPLERIGRRALESLPDDHPQARERVEEMLDFCAFFEEESAGLLARWHARRAARERSAGSHDPLAVASGIGSDA